MADPARLGARTDARFPVRDPPGGPPLNVDESYFEHVILFDLGDRSPDMPADPYTDPDPQLQAAGELFGAGYTSSWAMFRGYDDMTTYGAAIVQTAGLIAFNDWRDVQFTGTYIGARLADWPANAFQGGDKANPPLLPFMGVEPVP